MRCPLAVAALAALIGCAPLQRVALKRCPTTIASLADFTGAAVVLGASALAYNSGSHARALGLVTVGMGWALASNHSECRR